MNHIGLHPSRRTPHVLCHRIGRDGHHHCDHLGDDQHRVCDRGFGRVEVFDVWVRVPSVGRRRELNVSWYSDVAGNARC